MNNIEKHSKIDEKKLSREFYFQSLLQEAYLQGELSESESDRIQAECLSLLTKSTERYTKGKSSSVRVEIAQSLMASNLFTIGIYLKSLPDVSTVLYHIINEPIKKLYEYGLNVIDRKLNVAKYFLHLVGKTKITTQNHAYNATIDKGLKLFFEQYNINFNANEIPGSIDYQLVHPVTDLAGIEYITEYLQYIYYENLFCKKFESDIINEVMYGYDEAYKDLLDNICEQVLQNALGCSLLKKNIPTLDLSLLDIKKIESELSGKSQAFILERLQNEAKQMFPELQISNKSVKQYLLASLPKIALKIHTAINTDTLNKVFVARYNPDTKPIIHYNMGIKMDDKTYRDMVSEFLSCRYFEDKLQIIKENIKTLADMEDILIAGELSPAESSLVFDLLDDVEITALVKRHPVNEEIKAIDYSEAEIQMQHNLAEYLENMPKERLEQIYKMMPTIEVV